MRLHGVQVFCGLFHRQIGDQRAVHTSVGGSCAKFLQAKLQNRIEVREDNQPRLRLLSDLLRYLENASQVGSMLQRPLACPLNDRAICDRIAERYA